MPDAPSGTPDGPPGSPDAMVPGTATVRVSQEDFDPEPGLPIEGARIAVIPPGGGAPELHMTDATGVATFELRPGSDLWVGRDPVGVPAAVPGLPSYDGRLYYLEKIDPGADITLGAPAHGGVAGTSGTLTINYTPYMVGSPGAYDSLLADCTDYGDNTVPGTINFAVYDYATTGGGCGGGAARELVIAANDLTTGAPAAWLTVPGVATVPGTIDATAGTWDDVGTTYTIDHSNDPAEVTYAYSYFRSAGSWHGFSTAGSIATTGSYSITDATLPLPMVIATELYNAAGLPQWVVDPVTTAETSHAVDGATLLPYIASPGFDPATRTIRWSTATPGSAVPHVVTAAFSYYDSVSATQFRWTIYAPGDVAELVIPDVPDAVTDHDLQPTDIVYPDVWLIDVAGSDYADLLTDLDLHRNNPASGYRLGSRVLASGGYDIGK